MRSSIKSLLAGLAGAAAMTAVHQALASKTDDAPRLDVLGEQSLAKAIAAAGFHPPRKEQLYWPTLVADIVANAGYFSLAGAAGRQAPWVGTALGGAAGIASAVLPGHLGLDSRATNRSRAATAWTIGVYVLGGLAAGASFRLLSRMSAVS